MALTAALLTLTSIFLLPGKLGLGGLFPLIALIFCAYTCIREPFDGPWRFAPVVIIVTALALQMFFVPA